MSRIRSCDSPPPFCGGISCSGDQSEDKRCNIHCCGNNSNLQKLEEFHPQGWMAAGVPGPRKVPAARLVEGEGRGGHGPATVRHLLVGEATVLGHQLNSPSATLSVVVTGCS